jgi:hypothetical protein
MKGGRIRNAEQNGLHRTNKAKVQNRMVYIEPREKERRLESQ